MTIHHRMSPPATGTYGPALGKVQETQPPRTFCCSAQRNSSAPCGFQLRLRISNTESFLEVVNSTSGRKEKKPDPYCSGSDEPK